jgi:hypothetical protein
MRLVLCDVARRKLFVNSFQDMDGMKKDWLNERSFLIVCIVLGAVQAWICRYSMISDGMSYLDIGDAYMRHDWAAAVNAYWSPLYSWCLGLALYLIKPSIWWEYVTVHAVNLIIFVVALFCFRFFIHSVLRALSEETGDGSAETVPLPEWTLLALGYGIFLWCSLVMIDLGWVTPDLLVAAILFLIAGYIVDLRVRLSYWKFAVFGALNGLAYLGKGIMFPLGFGFLAILLFSGKITKTRIRGVVLATVVFVLVCAPFIFALSKAKGRLTFGDTGKLAYAALVSPQTPQIHWQGQPAGSGIPRHATRKLQDDPPVFEFGEPVRGTYPPWDDPSYWNEGVQPHFNVRSQLRVLVQSAFAYEKMFLGELGLLVGALTLLFMGARESRMGIARNWPLLAAALLSIVAYSLVLVIARYLGGSIVLFWVAIVAGIRLKKDATAEAVTKYLAAAVVISILFSIDGHLTEAIYSNVIVGANPTARNEIEGAVGLENMGLREGDEVAVIGYGELNHWARLGRFRIVAETPSPDRQNHEFWGSAPERRDAAYECLRSTGARAVVVWDPPASKIDPRWERVADTRYYAYFFRK